MSWQASIGGNFITDDAQEREARTLDRVRDFFQSLQAEVGSGVSYGTFSGQFHGFVDFSSNPNEQPVRTTTPDAEPFDGEGQGEGEATSDDAETGALDGEPEVTELPDETTDDEEEEGE